MSRFARWLGRAPLVRRWLGRASDRAPGSFSAPAVRTWQMLPPVANAQTTLPSAAGAQSESVVQASPGALSAW